MSTTRLHKLNERRCDKLSFCSFSSQPTGSPVATGPASFALSAVRWRCRGWPWGGRRCGCCGRRLRSHFGTLLPHGCPALHLRMGDPNRKSAAAFLAFTHRLADECSRTRDKGTGNQSRTCDATAAEQELVQRIFCLLADAPIGHRPFSRGNPCTRSARQSLHLQF
jgi:hypothetical protein